VKFGYKDAQPTVW